MNYVHSHREEWVLRFYERMNIFFPSDIDIHSIAYHHRIYIKFWDKPSNYKRLGRFQAIYLQYGLSPEEERIQFFHELGHLLRHSGSQFFMTSSFAELQEWDANLFAFYAALPWHMLKQYDLNNCNTITQVSQEFCVPIEFVDKRMLFIKQKIKDYEVVT
ncbi:ImmA/IrrE family metallo-endopeptidase [Alteribacter populi]|uniref:ImmA/IrrE family metallo-endopeptidase n=1 Tax=Alteribacter populi TaxID=2011011 RepID=UPI000BBABDD0|nr:ImmA/IrrE family metallo-endopeptidase [Alteribacter populi]